jgi:hypothetical protein
MKPIMLEVFIHDDEARQEEDPETPYSLKGSPTEPIKFYVIAAISSYKDQAGKRWGCIHANGREFISPLSAKELDKLISENL